MQKPYPGLAPNIKSVTTTGGYHRDCMVIDILSLSALQPTEVAMIEEQMSAHLAKLVKIIPNIHKCELVTSGRFDKMLAQGLRLG